jgi:hypothetical protein
LFIELPIAVRRSSRTALPGAAAAKPGGTATGVHLESTMVGTAFTEAMAPLPPD